MINEKKLLFYLVIKSIKDKNDCQPYFRDFIWLIKIENKYYTKVDQM